LAELTRAGEMFGERLRELRNKRGLTQVTLAETSGIKQSHISSMERGMMLPNLLTLMRLAFGLGCNVSALVSVFDKQNLAKLLPK
jgi:transcriptional regulator with XRE-family HTH domain